MGQKIVLTDTFTDTTMPILYNDPGISAGTLYLWDPAHSMGAFTGVPANAAAMPNVAANIASGITGISDQTKMQGSVDFVRDGSTALLTERTTKGGLHLLPSQANMATAVNRYVLRMPNAIRDFIFNNIPSDALYVSYWAMLTRLQLSTAAPASAAHFTNNASATTNYLYQFQGNTQNAGISLGGTPSASPAINTPTLFALGSSGWLGSKPSASSSVLHALLGAGAFDAWESFNQNKAPGMVFYRAKIEDLTKTKRANSGAGGTIAQEYAAALAQDQADFAAAFASGGKFNGDTLLTSPSSFA